MGLPILYSFRRCPYAMRARMAIAVSGQEVEHREVVLKDKPAAMLEASPKGTVPVLVLPDGTVIDESLAVMDWALGERDPEGWRAPLDEDGLSLIAENDRTFKRALDRYKYPNRYGDVDPLEHRALGLDFLRRLEGRLAEAPYLCGDRFSYADAAIAPFVRQFANVDRDWFDGAGLSHVPGWLDGILESERFSRVMEKHPKWVDPGGFAGSTR